MSTNDAAFEVVVGQGRILTTKADIAVGKAPALVAVGDPSIVDFKVVSPRQIRVVGLRIGLSDLSITTSDNRTYSFEVRVVADLNTLRGQLQAIFPDARLKLGQIRDHIVVEGQARDTAQIARILDTIRAYLVSVQSGQLRRISTPAAGGAGGGVLPVVRVQPGPENGGAVTGGPQQPPAGAIPPAGAPAPDQVGPTSVQGTIPTPQIINLIRVPGPQQVLLKVRVAELNRTGMREIGADFLGIDPDTGALLGTQIGGASISAVGTFADRALTAAAEGRPNLSTTVFGIFESAHFEFLLRALRRNALLKILAEPNLVAMNGHQASFLAGGEFPVPIPQAVTGGAGTTVTVQFREFGVRLGFVPFILDNDVIRLSVAPEVSSIDFTLGTVLVPGGSPVPGLNTRKAQTTVELREGQTLAIAGLLQLTLDGQTRRIPGLGDLPILGPFFSNTTNSRLEKELVVLVTPYLVEPMNHGQVPPTPGDEVLEPTDLEFYFHNRIEGRKGQDFRSTTAWDDPLHLNNLLKLQKRRVAGPHGFSD
ncbi:MAG: pilus assembly protein N-terminal domain-containing protein [Gemmataceae bacterium]|nr:pilus assembly protein N-terminal domain-containing protein [Gemmataceae bacterium]